MATFKRQKPTSWTGAREARLRAEYPHRPTSDLAREFGVSVPTLHWVAKRLGLRKSPEYLARMYETLAQRQHGKRTQFQPGLTPWNKGMKGLDIGGKQTRFKPGQRPHNEQPIGAYRVVSGRDGKGVLKQKTRAHGRHSAERWAPVIRLVWEEVNGPVPAGHIVRWKDPRQASVRLEEITLDKLECISRAEHARRNQPKSKSPELAKLVQLKGAITRAVRRIEKASTSTKQETP